ncbi:MAG: S8 family serine peptidase [Vulcanimicrobiota bacterium]
MLILIDSFEKSTSHGYLVEGAAQTMGPPGGETYHRVSQHQQVDGRPSMPHLTAISRLQAQLAAGPLDGPEAREHLEHFVVEAAAGNLQLATSLLKEVEGQNFQNSVVNLSQGLDSLTLLHLANYPMSPKSRLEPHQQQTYRTNLLRAAACDSDDPVELDRRLLMAISGLVQSSADIEKSRQDWRAQVRSFESAHNSVVVAAGNSGQAMQALARAGFELNGNEDLNLLSVEEVTTVGASTTDPGGTLSLASSSSFGPEVDIVADGNHAGTFGTSFASPRVANLMRLGHVLQPELSSAEVEDWLKANLAEVGQIGDHSVAIVDSKRAANFVARFAT